MSALLTPFEADNAIYFDFEGHTDWAPSLLGVLYAEGSHRPHQDRLVLCHDIVERELWPMVDACGSSIEPIGYRPAARSLRASVQEVVLRARAQDRLIVSWSTHDRDVVVDHAHLDVDIRAEFEKRFRDGKDTAKVWAREVHPEYTFPQGPFETKHRLGRYMELVNFEVPESYGPGKVSDNIRRVRGGLAKRGTYDALLASQRLAWGDVLGHNMYDCFGLRHVVRLAATQLEAATRPIAV